MRILPILFHILIFNYADSKLTQEVKRHAIIVAMLAEHSNLQIAQLSKVVQSFVFMAPKEVEDNDSKLTLLDKRKIISAIP